jgi:hypothetical protein
VRRAKNIGNFVLVKSCGIIEFADQDKGGPEIGVGILLAELLHGVLKSAGHFAGAEIFAVEELH